MSAPNAPNMTASRWIWPFEILEQIGEGGMGVVYRARYVVNNREVALKMLPGDVVDKVALARFERELEVLKTLRHPNIVRCFGGVCENKRRFYAMELISGGSLEDQIQSRGRIPWEQAIQYTLQMCSALECSHQKGVVHRDVKPSNFLITPDGQLKLSDFGLASVTSARKITAAGKTAGTFLYMAPEQIRGNDVGPPTDLYALGCVLYEMVTGSVPFQGATGGETLHLHCYSVPDRPTQKALDCPVQLERIILKLLEKSPEDRYVSAAQVARELGMVTNTVTVLTPRAGTHLSDSGPVPKQRTTPQDVTRQMPVPAALAAPSRQPGWLVPALAAALAVSLLVNASLMFSGGGASTWKDQWHAALSRPEPAVRAAAAETMGHVIANDESVVAVLRKQLEDSDPTVRVAALEALAKGGTAARSEISNVNKLLNHDPDDRVRGAAQRTADQLQNAPSRSYAGLILGTLFGIALTSVAGIGVWAWLKYRDEASQPITPRQSFATKA